jgi:hypothetical protein
MCLQLSTLAQKRIHKAINIFSFTVVFFSMPFVSFIKLLSLSSVTTHVPLTQSLSGVCNGFLLPDLLPSMLLFFQCQAKVDTLLLHLQ